MDGILQEERFGYMNSLTKYPGSKWSIAKWIIGFFPTHHSYMEPFLGSGAVLFNKPRSNIETINDLDGDVVNLFEWIQRDPEKLAHAIYWTPYSRQIYMDPSPPQNSLEKAVKFYISLNQGKGHRTTPRKNGWKYDIQGREKAYSARDWTQAPEKIMQAAERLRGVQIECAPAVELIKRHNYSNVLIYADPPYVLSARSGKQYNCEMDDAAQVQLLDILKAHKGPAIISGYDTPLYNSSLKSWHREETAAQNRNNKKTREILWMNFEPMRQMKMEDILEKYD